MRRFAAVRSKFIFCTLVFSAVGFAATGCSISQNVQPVPALDSKRICVTRNPDVRGSFANSLVKALSSAGLKVRLLEPGISPDSCEMVATYTANWGWDLALYLSYVEIKILREQQQIGLAVYDATHGGGRMDKFISADAKVNELVGQLFPDGKD